MRTYRILFEHMGFTNQQSKKLVSLLAVSLARLAKKQTTESTTTREVSPHEPSCLANCRIVVSIVAWFLYGLSKELVFMPVASALTGTHRDCLIVASFGQPEIQLLCGSRARGQIVSADLL